jgi:hypothetical protein
MRINPCAPVVQARPLLEMTIPIRKRGVVPATSRKRLRLILISF